MQRPTSGVPLILGTKLLGKEKVSSFSADRVNALPSQQRQGQDSTLALNSGFTSFSQPLLEGSWAQIPLL